MVTVTKASGTRDSSTAMARISFIEATLIRESTYMGSHTASEHTFLSMARSIQVNLKMA
jgi:hypothetical protein